MILFELKPQFDSNTGEPSSPKQTFAGLICDFCGHVFEDGYEMPDPTYKVEESGDIEPGWHEDTLILGEFEVDLYELFSTHPEFIYCQEWCRGSHCTMRMVDRWSEQRGINGQTDLGHLRELSAVMYECRYAVIRELHSKGYTTDQLGLVARE